MSEENVQVENEVVDTTSKPSFGAKVKEWLRKKTVALKRAPQFIPLFFFLIATIYFMFVLFSISQAVYSSNEDDHTPATGICTFITTLLSLLVLVSFLNSFPKRKKPNLAFIIITCLMIAGMLACDFVYYFQMNACMQGELTSGKGVNGIIYQSVSKAQPFIIIHIVLLGLASVVFALLPVIKILLNKIDTSVKLESATENMEKIDIED